MHLFLTHIDTPYRMYREALPFCDHRLMLSRNDLTAFDSVRAVCALWCDHRLTDEEGWRENRAMRASIKGSMAPLKYLLSVEDARILGETPLARLGELWDDGVRVITPMWRGVNRLGGAYDTSVGLTSYGRGVLAAAMERGFLLDISHASDESARNILELASRYRTPVLATHSNFRAVCPHPRNLSDDIADAVAACGGLIGISLVPDHVGGKRDIPSLLTHLRYAYTRGLGETLCLGTDLDGTDSLIAPLTSAKDLVLLADAMCDENISIQEVHALFFTRAQHFFNHRFPCRLE